MSAQVRQRLRWVVALFVACSPSVAAWGETAAELETRVAEQLRIEHNIAVELYNKPTNDPQAAYLYFRAALMAADRALEHRPDLQRAIRRGLEDARKDGNIDEKAWTLKHLTVVIRATMAEGGEEDKTLWVKLGGAVKIRKVIDEWVDAMIEDKRVNFTRDGKYPMGREQVAAVKESLLRLASNATGGPLPKYTGPTTKAVHEPMSITNAEYDAAVADLAIVMIRNRVPEAERSFMVGTVERLRPNFVRDADPGKSIVELIGGEDKLTRIASDFVDLMIADKRVNFTRNGQYELNAEKVALIKKSIAEMASEAMRGKRKYTGPKLLEIHKPMVITAAEFDAARADLNLALIKNGIPAPLAGAMLLKFDERRSSFVVK